MEVKRGLGRLVEPKAGLDRPEEPKVGLERPDRPKERPEELKVGLWRFGLAKESDELLKEDPSKELESKEDLVAPSKFGAEGRERRLEEVRALPREDPLDNNGFESLEAARTRGGLKKSHLE